MIGAIQKWLKFRRYIIWFSVKQNRIICIVLLPEKIIGTTQVEGCAFNSLSTPQWIPNVWSLALPWTKSPALLRNINNLQVKLWYHRGVQLWEDREQQIHRTCNHHELRTQDIQRNPPRMFDSWELRIISIKYHALNSLLFLSTALWDLFATYSFILICLLIDFFQFFFRYVG